jgi:hypothetical protein
MEHIPYPSDYFDPYGNEPTHGPCDSCGKIHDNGDLIRTGAPGNWRWLCAVCLEREEAEKDDA